MLLLCVDIGLDSLTVVLFPHARLFLFAMKECFILLHVLFFDWLAVNEQLFILQFCCRLHWS